MPRYDYRCCDCDVTFEVERPMADSGKIVMHCGQRAQRLFSRPVLNLGHWRPDPRAMDGEAEFVAAGGYE